MKPNLSDSEAAHDLVRLEPRTVYEIVAQEGHAEIDRPSASIAWSGFAAGIAISFSLIAEAAFRSGLPDSSWRGLIENFGYTAGFLFVILSRLQLFTENTITAVLPTLADPCRRTVLGTARLWCVSLLANFAGASLAAWLIINASLTSPEIIAASIELSQHVRDLSPETTFMRALPAGFLIAGLVWMMPSAQYGQFWMIFFFTYLIALGDFTHVIVGSVEMMTLVFAGEAAFFSVVTENIAPTLAGNIIGGTGLFALLAWAQVRNEMEANDDTDQQT